MADNTIATVGDGFGSSPRHDCPRTTTGEVITLTGDHNPHVPDAPSGERGGYIAAELSPIGAFARAQIVANASGRTCYIQHNGSTYGIYSDLPPGDAVTAVMPKATPPGLVSEYPDVVTATEVALEKEGATGRRYWIRPTSNHTWGLFDTPQSECS
jgi:hypothetical protein